MLRPPVPFMLVKSPPWRSAAADFFFPAKKNTLFCWAWFKVPFSRGWWYVSGYCGTFHLGCYASLRFYGPFLGFQWCFSLFALGKNPPKSTMNHTFDLLKASKKVVLLFIDRRIDEGLMFRDNAKAKRIESLLSQCRNKRTIKVSCFALT